MQMPHAVILIASNRLTSPAVFAVPLILGWALLLAGCAGTPTSRDATPSDRPSYAVPRLSQEQASDVTIYAISLVGTP